MIRRPPRSTRTDTLFPYTTLFRSVVTEIGAQAHRLGAARAAVAGDDETFRINVDVGIADFAIAQPAVDRPVEILGSDLHAFLQERRQPALWPPDALSTNARRRSEERRVGKECVSTSRYR